ncbi:hypothetical protein [Corynebacterium macginleyi]|uniref:hypothetical protein n=1 Tax=Corynebacterium macginleyi TaxID=38290 RepID=UPI00190BA351|nr:hypothetical protein [Corynebacterium macginleyi]MBK4144063.1 hypothetical protein [Corynebacterium macginleyi]
MGRNAFCLERWSDGAEGIAAVGAVAARYSVLMNGNLTLKNLANPPEGNGEK